MTRPALILSALGLLFCLPARSAPARASDAPEGHSISWTPAGPGGGGWIQSIAWDPHDRDTLYVGCDVGGFYVSHDAGRHYEIRNAGLRDYFVEAIAVSPRDSRVILLGTEGGIYRTTDEGRHWQAIRAGFPPVERYGFSAPIGALCFDPRRPDVAFCGIGRPRWGKSGAGAIYRSEDAGLTWRNVSDGRLPSAAIVSGLEVKPDDSRTVLAATSEGVFRSDDGGNTWQTSAAGLPHRYAEELAFAPSRPGTVYVSLRTTARDGQAWNGGAFRSDDAGRTWRPANGDGMPQRVGKAGESSYMTSNIKELAVDPRDADALYAGSQDWVTAGLRKSTNAGKTWRVTTEPRSKEWYGWITQWGPSVECLAVSPADPDRVAFGTSGHVFVSLDAGKTWGQRYCRELPDGRTTSIGLEVTCLNRIVPDPVRPRRAYFCYMDIGLLISDDAGGSFRRSAQGMKYSGNCFTVAVDPDRPATLWAGTGEWGRNAGDICRSDDGGKSWRVVGRPESGLPDGQTRSLLLDPKSPSGRRRLLVTVNGSGLYESRDDGDSWQAINGDLPAGAAASPRGLLMDPGDPQHLLAAFGGLPAKGAGLYESRDGGAHWAKRNSEPLFADITCLAADPRDFRTLYVTTREAYDQATKTGYPGGAFRSTDGGRTWQRILDYHFVSCIAVGPGALYAGTNDHPYHDESAAEGVLRSTDGGATWTRENTGLSLLNVTCLAVDPHDPALLYAGTGGNSAFVGRVGK